MRSGVSRSKIFKLLLALVLFLTAAFPVEAIRILNPGDTVNGKKIEDYYYCFSEEENQRLIVEFRKLEKLEQLLEVKTQEIANLQTALTLQKMIVEKKDEETKIINDSLANAIARERVLDSKVIYNNTRARQIYRKGKINFWFGLLSGFAILLGARQLGTK